MNNRKILTLNEILSLDRRPTLQEMVDLSIEDYTKYLYHKGIIKYLPDFENGENIYDLSKKDLKDFNDCEFVLNIIDSQSRSKVEEECFSYDKDFYPIKKEILNETISNCIESGVLYINEKEYHYILEMSTCEYSIKNGRYQYGLDIYEINENGDWEYRYGGYVEYMNFYDYQMLNEQN